MDPTTVAGLITALGLGAGFAAAITALFQRKKVGADATQVITAAALSIVEPLRETIADLRAELVQSQARVATLEAKLAAGKQDDEA